MIVFGGDGDIGVCLGKALLNFSQFHRNATPRVRKLWLFEKGELPFARIPNGDVVLVRGIAAATAAAITTPCFQLLHNKATHPRPENGSGRTRGARRARDHGNV